MSGQSKRDELFGGRRDVESGEATERSAEAKLDEADQYQDKTEEAYKVRRAFNVFACETGEKMVCASMRAHEKAVLRFLPINARGCRSLSFCVCGNNFMSCSMYHSPLTLTR